VKRKLHTSMVTKFSYVFLGVMCVVFLFPIYMAIVVSFTAEESIIHNGYQLIPEKFSIEAYRLLLTSYGTSLLRSLVLTVGTGLIQPLITIFLTMCMAYPLSQSDFKGGRFWRIFLIVTMLFQGGLIPTYILYTRYLGLRDNIMVYMMPTLGAWSIFLFRTFFVSIDKSLVESAKIDGANKMKILLKIMLPLTKPLVAMNFFQGFLNAWNNITAPLYYITDRKLYSVQYLLQEMLRSAEDTKKLIQAGLVDAKMSTGIPIESTRFALAVIGALPVFLLFPYLQKYYAKGVAVGSTKG